jgi:hypothetical protein
MTILSLFLLPETRNEAPEESVVIPNTIEPEDPGEREAWTWF